MKELFTDIRNSLVNATYESSFEKNSINKIMYLKKCTTSDVTAEIFYSQIITARIIDIYAGVYLILSQHNFIIQGAYWLYYNYIQFPPGLHIKYMK